mgnify:CR=1 FL=1
MLAGNPLRSMIRDEILPTRAMGCAGNPLGGAAVESYLIGAGLRGTSTDPASWDA